MNDVVFLTVRYLSQLCQLLSGKNMYKPKLCYYLIISNSVPPTNSHFNNEVYENFSNTNFQTIAIMRCCIYL